jgi:hypothetical protein
MHRLDQCCTAAIVTSCAVAGGRPSEVPPETGQ